MNLTKLRPTFKKRTTILTCRAKFSLWPSKLRKLTSSLKVFKNKPKKTSLKSTSGTTRSKSKKFYMTLRMQAKRKWQQTLWRQDGFGLASWSCWRVWNRDWRKNNQSCYIKASFGVNDRSDLTFGPWAQNCAKRRSCYWCSSWWSLWKDWAGLRAERSRRAYSDLNRQRFQLDAVQDKRA